MREPQDLLRAVQPLLDVRGLRLHADIEEGELGVGQESDMNFDVLTAEQKAKARAAKTPEEVLALAKEEGYELSDEDLEGISGGWGCNGQNFNCGMVGR